MSSFNKQNKMLYLVQENVFREPNYNTVFDALNDLNLEYEVVRFIKGKLEFETIRKDVFVYGSVKLARVAKSYDWTPGSFYGGNHDFTIYSKAYGKHLLNHDSTIHQFAATLTWAKNEVKFIRPARDSKLFTGRKFTESEWIYFVDDALIERSYAFTKETLIQVTPPKRIYKEARVWIVDGKIVTTSYYLFHGIMDYEDTLMPEGLAFAQEMVDLYQVADAFVMDICLTPEGWKIVEVNCINSAGIYKADLHKLFLALEDYGDKVNG